MYTLFIASYPGPRRAWYAEIAHVLIFPNFSGNNILQYIFRALTKELHHVWGWESIGVIVAVLISCVCWCCSRLFGSVEMAGLSLKEEQHSTIKAVLEVHSFFIQLC